MGDDRDVGRGCSLVGGRRRRATGTRRWSNEEGDAPGAGAAHKHDGEEGKMVGRRRFLLLGIGGTAAALVGAGASAGFGGVTDDGARLASVGRLGLPGPAEEPNEMPLHCVPQPRGEQGLRHQGSRIGQPHPPLLRVPAVQHRHPGHRLERVVCLQSERQRSISAITISRALFEAAVVRSLAPVPDPPAPTALTPASPPHASTPVAIPASAPTIGPAGDPGQALAAESTQIGEVVARHRLRHRHAPRSSRCARAGRRRRRGRRRQPSPVKSGCWANRTPRHASAGDDRVGEQLPP